MGLDGSGSGGTGPLEEQAGRARARRPCTANQRKKCQTSLFRGFDSRVRNRWRWRGRSQQSIHGPNDLRQPLGRNGNEFVSKNDPIRCDRPCDSAVLILSDVHHAGEFENGWPELLKQLDCFVHRRPAGAYVLPAKLVPCQIQYPVCFGFPNAAKAFRICD